MQYGSKEYKDEWARRLGYEDHRHYVREWQRNKTHRIGLHTPMEDDKNCSDHFGVYLGEKIFKKFFEEMFEDVRHSGLGSKDGGVDFYCKNPKKSFIDKYPRLKLDPNKEYKFQIKNKCLAYRGKSIYWGYRIGYNNKADFFILCGWDDRENLNPIHVWIFHKNDIIRGRIFWRRESFQITNRIKYLLEFRRYELIDKLDILKNIMKDIKENKENMI